MEDTDEKCAQNTTIGEDPKWQKKSEATEKITEIISGLNVTHQEMLWIFKRVEGSLTLTANTRRGG